MQFCWPPLWRSCQTRNFSRYFCRSLPPLSDTFISGLLLRKCVMLAILLRFAFASAAAKIFFATAISSYDGSIEAKDMPSAFGGIAAALQCTRLNETSPDAESKNSHHWLINKNHMYQYDYIWRWYLTFYFYLWLLTCSKTLLFQDFS